MASCLRRSGVSAYMDNSPGVAIVPSLLTGFLGKPMLGQREAWTWESLAKAWREPTRAEVEPDAA